MDEYERFLITRMAWYWLACRADVEKIGRPQQIHFASQSMRYTFEAYEECLIEYRKHNATARADDDAGQGEEGE